MLNYKDDTSWIKCCIMLEVEGIRHGMNEYDMLTLCHGWKVQACPERIHSLGINGKGESRGQLEKCH